MVAASRPTPMPHLPRIKTFILPLLFAISTTVGLRAVEEPPVAKAVPVARRDVTTQLQIFLDQQLFGPGKIDGRPGEFVGKALKRYQQAHGLPATGVLNEN